MSTAVEIISADFGRIALGRGMAPIPATLGLVDDKAACIKAAAVGLLCSGFWYHLTFLFGVDVPELGTDVASEWAWLWGFPSCFVGIALREFDWRLLLAQSCCRWSSLYARSAPRSPGLYCSGAGT